MRIHIRTHKDAHIHTCMRKSLFVDSTIFDFDKSLKKLSIFLPFSIAVAAVLKWRQRTSRKRKTRLYALTTMIFACCLSVMST